MGGRLNGKRILVTGGAGAQGQGAAVRFCAEGARVAVADIDLERAKQTARLAGNAVPLQVDVADEPSVRAMVDAARSALGGIDVLYNNAGINNGGTSEAERDRDVAQLPLEVWRRMIDVNLTGSYLCAKHTVPLIVESGGGAVINISSTAGLRGSRVSGHAYASSKGGVISLTRSMAAAYAAKQVRVNAICPGTLEALMVTGIPRNEERRRMLTANYPLGRLGTVEDVVHLAVYLASDESSWVTGAVIPVDGGMTAAS